MEGKRRNVEQRAQDMNSQNGNDICRVSSKFLRISLYYCERGGKFLIMPLDCHFVKVSIAHISSEVYMVRRFCRMLQDFFRPATKRKKCHLALTTFVPRIAMCRKHMRYEVPMASPINGITPWKCTVASHVSFQPMGRYEVLFPSLDALAFYARAIVVGAKYGCNTDWSQEMMGHR